jgi:hypothetical protein
MPNLILNDPKYLGVALALLGLVGGGFLSWLFTFYYFKKAQSRRLLCYTARSISYLGFSRADFNNLSVHYGERQLLNPARYTLYIWNCGNVIINHSDISQVDPLGFGQADIEILEIAPIWSTCDSINAKVLIDADKTRVIVEFDFLDPDDGFAVEFLADHSAQQPLWPNALQAYGTVKGLNRAPFHAATGFEQTSWWGTYVAIAAALFFAFSSAAIIYDAWQFGMVLTGLVKVLAAIIFGLISMAIMAFCFERFGDSSFVIPALLRRPGDMKADIPPQLFADFENTSRSILRSSTEERVGATLKSDRQSG